ncbi:HNH endonuclease signature motif containing protein [Amycolatopsis oliviviridis]|uniref:HNH endonuclease n=1 Tax=Amycolatopsis oliviviridis TaxID=1471590 RepID=A0ABQ3M5K7_9PSEU|nr:HNH endonuclease signature motif containing protein [Amycolatopsis oliviviridis]GHH34296.1 HNH endonuclease [Amycolatopsis oliviviridis]
MANDSASQTTPTEWWRVDTAVLHARKQELEVLKRQLDAEQNAILAEINLRGVRGCSGHSTLAAMIYEDFHVTEKEAKDRADRVLALYPGPSVGGDPAPPLAPLTAGAAAEGAIGGSQIDAIIRTLARIPSWVPEEKVRGGEKILVGLARHAGPRAIARAGRRLLDKLDPDGKEPRNEDPKDVRPELRFVKHRDGTLGLKGTLDLETYARLKSDLDPMAKPHKAIDGVRDSRTQDERYGDAFTDYVRLKTTSRNLPGQAGEATHILVTMSYEDLINDLGEAHLDLVGPISATDARILACDARVRPGVLGTAGEPLDIGRSKRTVSLAQKYALTIRDGGCAFPGCDMPVPRCTAHHIVFWRHHGETKIDNLVLLCTKHHRLIHHSEWKVQIAQDGLPEFIAPAYLDPTGEPRRNTMHLRT